MAEVQGSSNHGYFYCFISACRHLQQA